jgi:hypothetical protein
LARPKYRFSLQYYQATFYTLAEKDIPWPMIIGRDIIDKYDSKEPHCLSVTPVRGDEQMTQDDIDANSAWQEKYDADKVENRKKAEEKEKKKAQEEKRRKAAEDAALAAQKATQASNNGSDDTSNPPQSLQSSFTAQL